MTIQDVYENILRHLSEDITFSNWDISTAALKYVTMTYKCQEDDNPPELKIEDLTNDDWVYTNSLMMIFDLHNWNIFDWRTWGIFWIVCRTLLDATKFLRHIR